MHDRPWKDRLARALVYLERRAPLSVSGKGGHKALAGVCTHLVVFLGLDPHTAFHLLTRGERSWNSRCTDVGGRPFPWDGKDLLRACADAVDGVPSAGVKAWQRAHKEREDREQLCGFTESLRRAVGQPGGQWVAFARIHRLFCWFGLQGLSAKRLGGMNRRLGIKCTLKTAKRTQHIADLNYSALVRSLLERKRLGMAQRDGGGCALKQHQSSLEKVVSPFSQVERIVSKSGAT